MIPGVGIKGVEMVSEKGGEGAEVECSQFLPDFLNKVVAHLGKFTVLYRNILHESANMGKHLYVDQTFESGQNHPTVHEVKSILFFPPILQPHS